MNSVLRVDLFCEDNAHESCARALVGRIGREERCETAIRTVTASAGIPRLKQELRAYNTVMKHTSGTPHLLVILIDANTVGPHARRSEVEDALNAAVFPEIIIGTPDPCVERWLLSDPVSFHETFGVQPEIGTPNTRHDWKRRLTETLENADQIVVQGGAEFAEEIVESMDFYRAGHTDPTIRAFSDDLHAAFRRLV